jgi:hypothetical protein
LDGRTPPANAEEVRQGFSKSQQLIIEVAEHGNELVPLATALNHPRHL